MILMEKKTVVITGASSGIGYETADLFAREGFFVIGVGRSGDKCRDAEQEIKKRIPGSEVFFITTDLSSLEEVVSLAGKIKAVLSDNGYDKVDVLVNNAGIYSDRYRETTDKFEEQFAVNYLSAFLLTLKLLHLMKASTDPRVVIVSSKSHYFTSINWKDIMYRKFYIGVFAYKQSKLANVLFTAELNRRYNFIKAVAFDPGLVKTKIAYKNTGLVTGIFWLFKSAFGVEPTVPAKGIFFLSTDWSVRERKSLYWKNSKPARPSVYSESKKEAKKLWELSEKLCSKYL